MQVCMFHLILVDIPPGLIFSVKTRVGGGMGLQVSCNAQNLLRMAVVIFQQSQELLGVSDIF